MSEFEYALVFKLFELLKMPVNDFYKFIKYEFVIS